MPVANGARPQTVLLHDPGFAIPCHRGLFVVLPAVGSLRKIGN